MRFGLISLFNGISTSIAYLIPIQFLWKIAINSRRDEKVHKLPKAQLDFEIAYFEAAVKHFKHLATDIL